LQLKPIVALAIPTQSNFEELSIDLYAGQIVDFEDGEEDYKELIGARASYNTPMPGLKLMTSIYHSGLEESGESGQIKTLSFSASYHPDKLSLEMEIARKSVFDETIETYYVQIGYTLQYKWTPFIRYDTIRYDDITTDKDNRSNPSFYQQSSIIGLGYIINKNFGLRVEHHFNKGYGLAVVSEEVIAGTGKKTWSMSALSLNVIF